jgi:hypothetical protein
MHKLFFFVVFSVFCLGSATAQTFIGKINPFPAEKAVQKRTKPLKILAVMVEFQTDKDGTTVGNGKFGSIYSLDYGKEIIDPLPFDKNYFSAHLEFAKNYFEKVSNSNLQVNYEVLPQVVTVSKTIREYSPAPKSNDFTGMGNFCKEVWSKVDSANPGFDFGGYDVFLIFHAGVGRDVTLPGSLGNERDMPSVYLGTNGLQNIFGSSFDGFPVGGGKYRIPNTMILPCTESREVTSFGTTYLFQITINGLLVSSIGSHLGLPDLFDTKTGITAIGRFGLMDGQSIFAYMGAFPPQPSAWEKIYLGWINPVEVSTNKTDYSVMASLNAGFSDTVALKVPINSREYFLVENRNRDINKDGAKVTYYLDGNYYTKYFPKDTTFFNSSAIDSLKGVITNVDEFDWAVPGNGLVIWHIDDNIINAKIADNKVNVDKSARGIVVMEADGIKDIGEQFTTVFGDIVTGEGNEDDFWFKGNQSRLYTGRFDKNSRPNTNSNSGANSLISMSDFSAISPKMSLKITYGDSLIKPVYKASITSASNKSVLSSFIKNNQAHIFVATDNNLTEYNLSVPGNFMTQYKTADYKPAIFQDGNTIYSVSAYNNTAEKKSVFYISQMAEETRILRFDDTLEFIGSPYIFTNKDDGKIYAGIQTKSAKEYYCKLPGDLVENPTPQLRANTPGQPVYKVIDSKEGYVSYLLKNGTANNSGKVSTPYIDNALDMAMFKNSKGEFITCALDGNAQSAQKSIKFAGPSGNVTAAVSVSDTGHILTSLAAGDLKNDGENYIVYYCGKNVEAVNPSGAMALNFPFSDPLGAGFYGTPIVYDFAGDKAPEIIAATSDGRIYAIDGVSGKVVDGFPISTGTAFNSSPIAFTLDGQAYLAAVSGNILYAWVIGSATSAPIWSEVNGNGDNNSYIGAASKSAYVNSFFPSEKVYNYPNPAYNGQTYIRYYVSEDARINIKIFDISGDFVAELKNTAQGGMEGETLWNLNNIQSGVYLARVEATGSSGKVETKIIKIAVVK